MSLSLGTVGGFCRDFVGCSYVTILAEQYFVVHGFYFKWSLTFTFSHAIFFGLIQCYVAQGSHVSAFLSFSLF